MVHYHKQVRGFFGRNIIRMNLKLYWVKVGIIIMNNNGYVCMDALAALSVMFFISFSLFPILWKMECDRLDVRKSLKAQQVLYENLQSYYATGNYESLIEDPTSGGRYYTVLRSLEDGTAFTKGCVTYENSRKKEMEVCDVIKAGEWIYND